VAASVNDSRTEQIARCCDEMARCRSFYPNVVLPQTGGAMLGEMDWLEEVHRLLYEETP
jgi:hypothetical protein